MYTLWRCDCLHAITGKCAVGCTDVSASESAHVSMCTPAYLYSAHMFALTGRLVVLTQWCEHKVLKGHYFDFTGESVSGNKCSLHCTGLLGRGIIRIVVWRRVRVKATLMCGLITSDKASTRQSHCNYALVILKELRSRRTLWKSVYPAAE